MTDDSGGDTIGGAKSLMDLKAKIIESHYGYVNDQWIKLHFINYVATVQ
jgi:hypothetical protein